MSLLLYSGLQGCGTIVGNHVFALWEEARVLGEPGRTNVFEWKPWLPCHKVTMLTPELQWQCLALSPHSKKFQRRFGPWALHVFCVCVNMRRTGCSKLFIGASVCVNGCLVLLLITYYLLWLFSAIRSTDWASLESNKDANLLQNPKFYDSLKVLSI